MGIFGNKTNNTTAPTETKGFYFGAPEAEAENVNGFKLIDYFEDFLSILHNLEHGKFIFTGRKGVGKSAITKYIKDTADASSDSFASILRISDYETQKIIQDNTKLEQSDILLFEWLILVNIVKLIVNNDCGLYTEEYSKLKKFLEKNSGLVNVDKFQIDEGFKKSGGEVTFGGLTHSFGGVFKNYFDVKVSKAPFYKLIPPLKDIVKIILDYPVNKSQEFWLLFDDLDINYNLKSESDNQKIIELIRLAKLYNNEVFSNNKAKILVFLREDIRNNLATKYPDSAKIFNSYEILINWYDHSTAYYDENSSPLKKLSNKRIELNFKKYNINFESDPWNFLFANENYANYGQFKSSFKYFLDFTFYRPRDIVTFLSLIGSESYKFPINSNNLKKILNKFISINILEIKSELSLHFSENEKEKIFSKVLQYLADNQGVSYQQLLNKITLLNFSISPEVVIETLLSYSLIVFRDQNDNLYFNYRETPEVAKLDKGKYSLTLPKCIYHHFRRLY
jgi:hypothetical protein